MRSSFCKCVFIYVNRNINNLFRLEVILTHIPGKIGKKRHGDLFHSLDESMVKQLHSAEHDSDSSRLVFIISSLGARLMNTIGCSGFIRYGINR